MKLRTVLSEAGNFRALRGGKRIMDPDNKEATIMATITHKPGITSPATEKVLRKFDSSGMMQDTLDEFGDDDGFKMVAVRYGDGSTAVYDFEDMGPLKR